jgi:hypothetical protein
MSGWTEDELDAIGESEEIRLASLTPQGTLTKPVTVWVVRGDDELYVRSVPRPTVWFRHLQERREGRIEAAGIEKDVSFVAASDDVNDALDEVYRTKYREHAAWIIESITSDRSRSTTFRLVPHAPRSTSVNV